MYQSVIFMPHPPIIMEEFGSRDRSKALCTIEGMRLLAKMIAKLEPETIVFISPHGNSFSNGTCLLSEPELTGDFASFGQADITITKQVNQQLTQHIYDAFEDKGFVSVLMTQELAKTYGIKAQLDHGVMVPMSFIDKEYSNYSIVHITPGQTPLEENYYLGKMIKDVVDQFTQQKPSKVVVVASGDMSHALLDDGPYAFNHRGPEFDQLMRDAISQNNPIPLIKQSNEFIEDAAQCGLRSFLMGFGYMDGLTVTSKVVSYEGPFGVGYLCGYLSSDSVIAAQSLTHNKGKQASAQQTGNYSESYIPTLEQMKEEQYQERIRLEDNYIRLARETVEYYVRYHKKYRLDSSHFDESFLTAAYATKRGCFVTLHKEGQLRGCIGTIEPNCEDLVDEIINNAISACSSDPRFHGVEINELKNLDISVDILYPIESITSENDLDVHRFGVIVEQGYKRGLLLPNLKGVDSVSEQVAIAKQKAGIVTGEYKLSRFEVERHEI